MSIRYCEFPRAKGLEFKVNISINESTSVVTIPSFDIKVQQTTYTMAGTTFTLAEGDQIFMTAKGLQHCIWIPDTDTSTGEDQGYITEPTNPFPQTGECYWLVNKTKGGDLWLVLEVAE